MKLFFTLVNLLLSFSIFGQLTITGNVTDKFGEPLLGVNVYVKGTYDGATTDIDGNFSFTATQADSMVLIASFIGFHEAQLLLDSKGQPLTIQLREKVSELNAVVITAGSFNASDESKRVVLKPLDIVTTAGATADIPGALNTLPGTQAVGETGRLFVRGGDGGETRTFIDGMLVYNAYGPSAPSTPGRSRFSPFMFKGMSFSTGGYSAEYGQALSSALILQSKDVAENDRTDISLMSVGADISTTRAFAKSSLAGKIQYTNLSPYFALAPQNLDWDKAPEGLDGNFTYRIRTSKTGMLKLYSNLSTSNMHLYEEEIGNPEVILPVNVSNDYAHLNANYREVLGEKWGVKGGLSWTRSNDFALRGTDSRNQDLEGYHLKAVADYQHSDRFALLMGGELLNKEIDQTLEGDALFLKQHVDETIAAGFVESEIFASTALAFKSGIRVEHNSLNGQRYVTPRFSTAYKTGVNSQVAVAYGQFYQSPVSQIVLTNPIMESEKASHYIANYQWIKEGQSFRIEAYEKRYSQLVTFTSIYDPNTFSSNGKGYARGLDVFWRDNKSFENVDYWISYSFLNTEREYRDYPGSYTPSFASTHNFSLVMKQFIEEIKSQIGVTYSFATSRPYNDLNSETYLSGRTPAYHDLSFNVSYLFSNQVIVHGMVNNVLGINNVFGYEYAAQRGVDGRYASRAITPPASRFIFLGIFITLSKNKGINQLPNL